MGWHNIKRDPADIAFSKWVRLRSKRCIKCGKLGTGDLGITGLDASHFISRRKEATRFDPLNVDSLCRSCHRWFGEHATEHMQWQIDLKGQQAIDKLILASNAYCKKNRALEAAYWSQRIKADYGIKV